MRPTRMLRCGLASAFLTLWLTGCATDPVVRTQTVEVRVPVLTPLPAGMIADREPPVLPAGTVTNEDVAEFVEGMQCTVWLLRVQLWSIRAAQPGAQPESEPVMPRQCG